MIKREIKDDIHAISNLITRQVNESEHLQTVSRITEANTRIMGFISRNRDRDIFQKDVEKELGVTRSTVSRVISLMESKGLIERHPVEHDTRLKKLVLTEKAMQLDTAIVSHIAQVENQMVDGFSEDELQQLKFYLQRMKQNLNQ